MRFDKRTLFGSLGVLTLLFVACGPGAAKATPTEVSAIQTPKQGGVAAFVIRSDPPGWDPWGVSRYWDPLRMIMEMVFSPMYQPAAQVGKGCEIQIEPELAQSWRYLDEKTIEFKLRQGVRWHDKPPLNGRELVADDVVYTFNERYGKGLAGKEYVGQLFYDRAEVVDKYTVIVRLKKPFDFITGFTAGHRVGHIVAREAAGADGKEWLEKPEKSWVGTGPFLFKEFQSGVKAVFERNPNYFKDGKPYLNGIEALIIPDTATRLAALRSGQLHIYPAASPTVMRDIRRTNAEMFVKSCPSDFHLQIMMRLDKPPYNDVRVRRAVSMAFDREAVIQTALGGDGMVAYQAWPLDREALKLKDFPSEVQQYMEYHPDRAKQLLAEAGYPNGFKTSVLWSPAMESPWQEVAETFITMLRGVGIDANYDMKEYAAYLREQNAQKYPEMNFRWSNSFNLDDIGGTYLWSKIRPPYPLSLAPDPEADRLVEEMWATLDPAKRKELTTKLQVFAADRGYRIVGPVWGNGVIARSEVKNLGWRGTNKMYGILFEQIWLDK